MHAHIRCLRTPRTIGQRQRLVRCVHKEVLSDAAAGMGDLPTLGLHDVDVDGSSLVTGQARLTHSPRSRLHSRRSLETLNPQHASATKTSTYDVLSRAYLGCTYIHTPYFQLREDSVTAPERLAQRTAHAGPGQA